MSQDLAKFADFGFGTPPAFRLGLATRGNSQLKVDEVRLAIDKGVNYLNWCGYEDSMSQAIRELKSRRTQLIIAIQLGARRASEAISELEASLRDLNTDYIDVVTFYYVEHQSEWERIIGSKGAYEGLQKSRESGKVRLLGLTSHQRKLAASIAQSGKLDMLMIRYNAAHRGAEREVFPVTDVAKIPVVAFTCLRWGALLDNTPDDPHQFKPPSAVECYRFVLSNPSVSVALMAPDNRAELVENLKLLDDWRKASPDEDKMMRQHGDRVYRTAGSFP
jgi:predicted aldo/keto reductase-like oxidoreductase